MIVYDVTFEAAGLLFFRLDCKSICHVKCSSALPATCGLPMELVDHYVTETMKRSVAPSPAAAMATSSLESAVKEERSGPSEGCWVKVLKLVLKFNFESSS